MDAWAAVMHEDIPIMHLGLSKLFAQNRIRVTVENEGSISAEGLSLELRSGNTVLHSVPFWELVAGPGAPHLRLLPHHFMGINPHNLMPRQREPFSFYWDERGPGDHVILSCMSFRQGKSYDVEVSVELLAGSTPKAQIEAIVTASNMKGEAKGLLLLDFKHVTVAFDDIYDVEDATLKVRPPFDLPSDTDSDDLTWIRNGGSEYERS